VSKERISPIPNGLLDVEMAAFPIATEAAFFLAPVNLDPAIGGTTSQLWRAAENELLRRFTGIRVEHVTSVRDVEWFGAPAAPARSLLSWFRDFVARYLEPRGMSFAPKPRLSADADPRWIARVLPPDLLAAGLWKGPTRPVRLDDSPPPLALNLRESGFAETHLHIGAGLDFNSHWISTTATLLDQRADLNRFKSPSGAFNEGAQLAEWLLRAAITRQFLGEFLAARPGGFSGDFSSYLTTQWDSLRSPLGLTVLKPLLSAVRDVITGQPGNFYPLKMTRSAFYKYCQSTVKYSLAATRLVEFDPLETYFPAQPGPRASAELLFTVAAFCEMERPGFNDPDFELAFWQTTRLRNIYYRHLTQRALTPGLAWFVRHFDRIGAGRQVAQISLARVAAEVSGAGRGLRYFEFRTSPPNTVPQGRAYIRNVFGSLSRLSRRLQSSPKAQSHRPLEEAGLICHFIRSDGGGKKSGSPHVHGRDTHANPDPNRLNPRGYRYQKYARGLRKQAVTVAWLLARYPHHLLHLRGIDLCTDELAVPAWVFVRTFRSLREVGERVSTHLAQRGRKVPPLRRTIHAGEDYPHLLTGLRLVDEAIRRLDLRPGDRLGHALALGFDPERWAQTTGTAVLPREVRLFDLAWEWECRTRPHGAETDSDRAAYLDRHIRDLSSELFDEALSPHRIAQLVDDLHTPDVLARAGYPNGPRPKPGIRRLDLVVRYLTEQRIFDRGSEPISVDTESEVVAAHQMQTWLRGEVATRGLAVEINPTSNFLIGNLGEWKKHPLFRMNAPDGGGINPVPLVVGSDDPLVFATGLPDEYPALARALADGGVPRPVANRWLEELRATGVQFRFTEPGSLGKIRRVPPDTKLLADIRNLFN
jgi:hypothetical protein